MLQLKLPYTLFHLPPFKPYLLCNLICRTILGTMINITSRTRIMPRISIQTKFHGNNWSEIEIHKVYHLGNLEHLDSSNQGWWFIQSLFPFKTPGTWDISPKPVWGGSYTWVVEKWGKIWSGTEPGVNKGEWRNTPFSHNLISSHPFYLMFSHQVSGPTQSFSPFI